MKFPNSAIQYNPKGISGFKPRRLLNLIDVAMYYFQKCDYQVIIKLKYGRCLHSTRTKSCCWYIIYFPRVLPATLCWFWLLEYTLLFSVCVTSYQISDLSRLDGGHSWDCMSTLTQYNQATFRETIRSICK